MSWTFCGNSAGLNWSCQRFLKVRLTPVYHILTVLSVKSVGNNLMQEPVDWQKVPVLLPEIPRPPLRRHIAATGIRIDWSQDSQDRQDSLESGAGPVLLESGVIWRHTAPDTASAVTPRPFIGIVRMVATTPWAYYYHLMGVLPLYISLRECDRDEKYFRKFTLTIWNMYMHICGKQNKTFSVLHESLTWPDGQT